jgi:phospholipase/lecithinase/hemolysin
MRAASLPVTAVCFFTLSATVFADPVSNLVVFGDSLSDNGNAYIATQGAFPGPNYAVGAYTDGPNTTPATSGPFGLWSDQLAQKLGVSDPLPFLSQQPGATDFAFASAQTGSNPPPSSFFVTDQVNLYLASVAGHASSQSLYTFWAGANDILDAGKATPVQAADNIANNIRTLAASGARTFLWLNLPPLGDTPGGRADPAISAALNAASSAFNAEWLTDLGQLHSSGVNVIGVDVNGLFDAIAAHNAAGCTVGPSDPLCFANVTTPAQGLTGVDPNTYAFWDTEHPTTAADALIADAALDDFMAAPEPVSGALAIAGLGLIGIAGFRRRRLPKSRI